MRVENRIQENILELFENYRKSTSDAAQRSSDTSGKKWKVKIFEVWATWGPGGSFWGAFDYLGYVKYFTHITRYLNGYFGYSEEKI